MVVGATELQKVGNTELLNQVMQLGKEGGEYLYSNLINIKSKMVIFEFKGVGGYARGEVKFGPIWTHSIF